MATTMHRLQISLPDWQHQFLVQRARRDGISVAEVLRRLIEREAGATGADDSLMGIIGIARDDGRLIRDTPVSEAVDLYLADAVMEGRDPFAPDSRKRTTRKRRS